MLIVFGGLPGTGKTTTSRAVAAALKATYLRVDAIEQAIRRTAIRPADIGAAGYAVAQAIAEANIADGRIVVGDCVNPVAASREGWRAAAARAGSRLVEIEIICSDREEHRRRITSRTADLPGHRLPSWDDVESRLFEPWDRPRAVIDTARRSPSEAVEDAIRAVETAP